MDILAHGNASKPDLRSYICTSSKVVREEEEPLPSNPGMLLVRYKLVILNFRFYIYKMAYILFQFWVHLHKNFD